MSVTLFDDVPALPETLPSPFAESPHPVAQRAAQELMAQLRAQGIALDTPGAGKMFGVLVVRTGEGRVGWLKAFSGMLEGKWEVDGFVPPAFSAVERERFWPRAEAELARLDEALRENGQRACGVRRALDALRQEQSAELAALRAKHDASRARRQQQRAAGRDERELNQESGRETVEERVLKRAHRAARARDEDALRVCESARLDLLEKKRELSQDSVVKMYDSYCFESLRGARRSLREIFAPKLPPGGAGDCAAPKLFSFARKHHFQPVALAEFWWGGAPREHGRFYPACSDKCRPILGHLLDLEQ